MNLMRIKKIADEKGITLTSIAERIDMSTANLHKCFKGNRIEAGDLEKIAQVLNVPISHFFDDENTQGTLQKNGSLAELVEVQRKYISRLENQLEVYEGKTKKKAG